MNAQLIEMPPPEVAGNPTALKAPNQAQGILAVAEAFEIDSPLMFQIAGEELQGVAARLKLIEEERFKITRPIDASKAAVMNFFRAPTEALEKASRILRDKMGAWDAAERAKLEQAKRDAEAKARVE